MEPRVFALRYLTRFVCIADRCEDTCCAGMQILISDENQRTLAQAMGRSAAEQNELGAKLQPLAEPAFGYRWALQRDEHKACLFLSPQKLCSVSTRYGEAAMPDPCALFPRVLLRRAERTEVAASLACPEAARLCLLSDEGDALLEWPQAALRLPAELLPSGSETYDACHLEVRAGLLALLRDRHFSLPARLMQIAALGASTAPFFYRGSAAPAAQIVERLRQALGERAVQPEFSEASTQGEPVIQTLLSLTTGLQARGVPRYNQLSNAVLRTYQLGALQLEPRAGSFEGVALGRLLWAVYLKKKARVDALLGPWLDIYLERYWVNDLYVTPYTRAPTLLEHAFQMILRGAVLKFFLVGHPAIDQLAAAGTAPSSAEELNALQEAVVETVQIFAKHVERDRPMLELVAGHHTPDSLGLSELNRAKLFATAL